MKRLEWLEDSRKILQNLPASVKRQAGFQLRKVQQGFLATDSKPMLSVGQGVEELRIWGESGTYRVIYLARLADAVYVLHTFQKKTQVTSQRDLELARRRLSQLTRGQ